MPRSARKSAKPRRRTSAPARTSGEDGTYTIHGSRSGSYRVALLPRSLLRQLPRPVLRRPGRPQARRDDQSDRAGHRHRHRRDPASRAARSKARSPTGSPPAPLQNARACAIEVGGESGERCAQTSAGGTYTIGSLPTGTYEVILSGGFGNPGFASERWDDQPIDGPGTPVAVTAGATVTGIDGDLPRGGTIRGTVTAASDASPIQSIEVCAFRGHQEEGRCLFTSVAGDLRIHRPRRSAPTLSASVPAPRSAPAPNRRTPTGVTQWYSAQATRADAQPLDVTPGSVLRESRRGDGHRRPDLRHDHRPRRRPDPERLRLRHPRRRRGRALRLRRQSRQLRDPRPGAGPLQSPLRRQPGRRGRRLAGGVLG